MSVKEGNESIPFMETQVVKMRQMWRLLLGHGTDDIRIGAGARFHCSFLHFIRALLLHSCSVGITSIDVSLDAAEWRARHQ